MKTITMLSVAIASTLATHLVLAAHADHGAERGGNFMPIPGHHAGGNHPPQDVAAVPTEVNQMLTQFDLNQDGQVTRAEMKTARDTARADGMLAQFDTNQDGQITQDEVQALRLDQFNQMDADGNGFLNIEEFTGGVASYLPGMSGPLPMASCTETMAPVAGWSKLGKPGKTGYHGHFAQAHFERLDTDSDGQLSPLELVANLPVFDRFDCNETGVVTKADLINGPCQKVLPETTVEESTTTDATVEDSAPADDTESTKVTDTESTSTDATDSESTSTDATVDDSTNDSATTDDTESTTTNVTDTESTSTDATDSESISTDATVEDSTDEVVAEVTEEDAAEVTAETPTTTTTVSSGHGGGAPCSTCHSN